MGYGSQEVGLALAPANVADELGGQDAGQDDNDQKEKAAHGDECPMEGVLCRQGLQFLVIVHQAHMPEDRQGQHQHQDEDEDGDGATQ